jgi:hypothetical protein
VLVLVLALLSRTLARAAKETAEARDRAEYRSQHGL